MYESGHYAAPAILILTIGISLLGMFRIQRYQLVDVALGVYPAQYMAKNVELPGDC